MATQFEDAFSFYEPTAGSLPWEMLSGSTADPMSQMLSGIGGEQYGHIGPLSLLSPFQDPSDFDACHIPVQKFYHQQKSQDVTFPPFDSSLPHEGNHYGSPRSDYSSQSGDTFSACHTDDPYSQVVHHRHIMSDPNMSGEPYWYPTAVPSPELPPAHDSGIAPNVLQRIDEQPMKLNHGYQNSTCSEPDAEGESDHDYPLPLPEEQPTKRAYRVEQIHRPSIAESTIDSMSEDFNEPEEEEDADYNPRRSSTKRTRRAGAGRLSTTRRSSSGTASGRVQKKSRRKSSDAGHARPFPCPLAQYGCQSTFVSKNEWKRHVSTQHIKLGFWRCDMCSIGDADAPIYNDFNRKDLFTQHLRRMHLNHHKTTSYITNENGEREISDEAMLEHQDRCYIVLRQNPAHSTCLFSHCDKTFNGDGSWEERMEHVGGHMEKDRKANRSVVSIEDWREDVNLRNYLEREGLIENDNGSWGLGDGRPKHQA